MAKGASIHNSAIRAALKLRSLPDILSRTDAAAVADALFEAWRHRDIGRLQNLLRDRFKDLAAEYQSLSVPTRGFPVLRYLDRAGRTQGVARIVTVRFRSEGGWAIDADQSLLGNLGHALATDCDNRGRHRVPAGVSARKEVDEPAATHGRTMRTMNVIQVTLAAAGLFVATGAMGTAQADDYNSVTLYTSAAQGRRLSCNAVNVSRKTLTITISIIDGTGHPLTDSNSNPSPQRTLPGTEVSSDYGEFTASTASEAYCAFKVSGTYNRDDVRAVLITSSVATTTTADGTTFPYFLTRVLEAH